MKNLELYLEYSRRELHDILDPESPFQPSVGKWGLEGAVGLPDRPGDFVFFVTFGQKQGEHEFDEEISENGELRWQSQPSQTLNDARINQWIKHDEARNTIYLFLRTRSHRDGQAAPYTFLGSLKYIGHDSQRERPVHFKWRLQDWPIPEKVLEQMNLKLEHFGADTPMPSEVQAALRLVDPPVRPKLAGAATEQYRKATWRSSPEKDAANRRLGAAGEKLVVAYERQALRDASRADLAERIVHTSEVEGDGAGYDVRSFTPEGELKLIEVKTTTGDELTEFYITLREVQLSEAESSHFYLYRVFRYDESANNGLLYIRRGRVRDAFDTLPIQFKVMPKTASDSESSTAVAGSIGVGG